MHPVPEIFADDRLVLPSKGKGPGTTSRSVGAELQIHLQVAGHSDEIQ